MIYIGMPKKYEKIDCKICGGRYMDTLSHKRIHMISNKHIVAMLREKKKMNNMIMENII